MTSFGHIVGEEAPLSVTVYPCLKHAQYHTYLFLRQAYSSRNLGILVTFRALTFHHSPPSFAPFPSRPSGFLAPRHAHHCGFEKPYQRVWKKNPMGRR